MKEVEQRMNESTYEKWEERLRHMTPDSAWEWLVQELREATFAAFPAKKTQSEEWTSFNKRRVELLTARARLRLNIAELDVNGGPTAGRA